MNRMAIATTVLLLTAGAAHAGGVLTGNTLSFPVTNAWQVERQWPASGIVCNSVGGAVSCDLEPGDYTWRDWSDGSSDNVTVTATSSGTATEGNLPMAPSLSIEYVTGRSSIQSVPAANGVGYTLDGVALTPSAVAACPAGSVLTGVTGCSATTETRGNTPRDVPAIITRSDNGGACVVDQHRLTDLIPLADHPRLFNLYITVEAACLTQ